ncbi:MAG: hypothetical protein DWQ44_03025 [Bacteroidetes bacterium]|nr:MAG: hypothetical protein DWQ33_04780 [Bacteroidota bacterium]REK00024.1 MAG: hypothetical protein DWQ39_14050 [Bacteroidota bacterium]REK35796.1 MAG: hypothetical protein DWQ44_03025 [Bacteroidota bacterium]REK49332.1 MAG: hypothetical protein DWQ48_07830 [Bacteroidota bacterium]
MSFYIAILCFIFSLVLGLVLMITAKNLPKEKLLLLASVHLLFLLAYAGSVAIGGSERVPNYFFMLFICSGLALSGLFIRSSLQLLFRVYFSLFTISIPMFLLSPSMTVNFLLSARYVQTTGQTFELGDNLILMEQGHSSEEIDQLHYKLIKKKGIFYSTLERDIDFKGRVDSVRVMNINPGKTIQVRAYRMEESYVSSSIDSMDAELPLKKKKHGTIEYRL